MNKLVEYAKAAYLDEMRSAMVYSGIAKIVRSGVLKEKLLGIAHVEEEHARFWRSFLARRGVDLESIKVSKLKVFLYLLSARLIGLGITIKLLENGESAAVEMYSKILKDESLDDEEREAIKRILEDELVHEHEFAEEEERYKKFVDHVRDIVLGMNDGLVEVLSVAAGLAGAYGNPMAVALGGSIVGVAGALSMGVGVFASTRAQRQVRKSMSNRLLLAIRHVPHAFSRKIRELMMKKG